MCIIFARFAEKPINHVLSFERIAIYYFIGNYNFQVDSFDFEACKYSCTCNIKSI